METPWDWVTVFIFAGLATLLLQRSTEEHPRDELWQYLPAALGCGAANYAGNEGYPIVAVVIIAAVLAYIVMVLKVKLPRF